ncbi:MAG: helix-turn-helix transcriptional regulator [Bacteroidales bacterium]|nr:helix-turn-helix transcriptional regulator [Bacteroidales bacterium]
MIHNPVLQRSIERLSPESKAISRLAYDVSDRIAAILKEKGMTQRDLAKGMGRTEAEVSKWLGGTQNFTIKTIALIQNFLGEPLIIVPNALTEG